MKYSKELGDQLRADYKVQDKLLNRPDIEDEIMYLLDEIDRLNAERRWIPVSQPPENEQDVLLYLHSGYVRIGAIDEDGEWFDIFCEPLIKVTHWQPLPPAPESEGE